VDPLLRQPLDRLLAEPAERDPAPQSVGLLLEEPGHVPLRGVVVHPQEEVGGGQVEEREGVRLHELGTVEDLGQLLRGVAAVALVRDDEVQGVDRDVEVVGVVLDPFLAPDAEDGLPAEDAHGHPLGGRDVDEGVPGLRVGQVSRAMSRRPENEAPIPSSAAARFPPGWAGSVKPSLTPDHPRTRLLDEPTKLTGDVNSEPIQGVRHTVRKPQPA
jgi:hypothetical protein